MNLINNKSNRSRSSPYSNGALGKTPSIILRWINQKKICKSLINYLKLTSNALIPHLKLIKIIHSKMRKWNNRNSNQTILKLALWALMKIIRIAFMTLINPHLLNNNLLYIYKIILIVTVILMRTILIKSFIILMFLLFFLFVRNNNVILFKQMYGMSLCFLLSINGILY